MLLKLLLLLALAAKGNEMSWLGSKLEQIGNLPGPHRALLKFDAGTIRGASMVGQKLFGDNVIGHMFDWGRREGEQNLKNPGRQFRKGVEFYAKAIAGSMLGDAIGGMSAGAGEAGTGTGATGGSVDTSLAGWGTEGGGAYAGSDAWEAGAAGAAAGAGSDLEGWGKEGSKYPGSDQWSTESTKASGTTQQTPGEKSMVKDIGRSIAVGAGTNLATSLLAPKAKEPERTKPTEMPDPVAQEQAARKKRIEQLARRGRAASILTDSR